LRLFAKAKFRKFFKLKIRFFVKLCFTSVQKSCIFQTIIILETNKFSHIFYIWSENKIKIAHTRKTVITKPDLISRTFMIQGLMFALEILQNFFCIKSSLVKIYMRPCNTKWYLEFLPLYQRVGKKAKKMYIFLRILGASSSSNPVPFYLCLLTRTECTKIFNKYCQR
jgi:hypothetical protein